MKKKNIYKLALIALIAAPASTGLFQEKIYAASGALPTSALGKYYKTSTTTNTFEADKLVDIVNIELFGFDVANKTMNWDPSPFISNELLDDIDKNKESDIKINENVLGFCDKKIKQAEVIKKEINRLLSNQKPENTPSFDQIGAFFEQKSMIKFLETVELDKKNFEQMKKKIEDSKGRALKETKDMHKTLITNKWINKGLYAYIKEKTDERGENFEQSLEKLNKEKDKDRKEEIMQMAGGYINGLLDGLENLTNFNLSTMKKTIELDSVDKTGIGTSPGKVGQVINDLTTAVETAGASNAATHPDVKKALTDLDNTLNHNLKSKVFRGAFMEDLKESFLKELGMLKTKLEKEVNDLDTATENKYELTWECLNKIAEAIQAVKVAKKEQAIKSDNIATKLMSSWDGTEVVTKIMLGRGDVKEIEETFFKFIEDVLQESKNKCIKKIKNFAETLDRRKDEEALRERIVAVMKDSWYVDRDYKSNSEDIKKQIEKKSGEYGDFNEGEVRETFTKLIRLDEGVFHERTKEMVLKILENYENSKDENKEDLLSDAAFAIENKDYKMMEKLSGVNLDDMGGVTQAVKNDIQKQQANYKEMQIQEFKLEVTEDNVIDIFAELASMGLDASKTGHVEAVTVKAIAKKKDEKDYDQNSLKDLMMIRRNKNIDTNITDDMKAMLTKVIVGKANATNEDDLKKNNNEFAKLIREHEDILNQLEPKKAELIKSLTQTQLNTQPQAVAPAASSTSTSKAESKKKGGKGNKKRRSRSNAKKRKGSKSKNRKRSKSRKKKA